MATMTRPRESQRGAELIEFALVFPILLLLVAGIIDFGFMFQQYEVVTNAAREGARVGVLPGFLGSGAVIDTANVEARVNAYIAASGLPGSATTAVAPTTLALAGGLTASAIQVTVSYPHAFVFLGPIATLTGGAFGTVTLTSSSVMRLEIQGS